MTYEISLYEEEELKKKKEKRVAFKVDIEEESDKNSEGVESDLSDHEMAFLSRKFWNIMRNKKYFPRKRKSNRKQSSKELEKEGERKMPMCFKCNKSGHLRSEYPHLSKEYKKKKKAFWQLGAIASIHHPMMNKRRLPTYASWLERMRYLLLLFQILILILMNYLMLITS